MKQFLKVILLILLSHSVFAQYTAWNYPPINFEAAGYVTKVYPALYKDPVIEPVPAIGNYVLYTRTDVGGIYRSGDNGVNWSFVSCYFRNSGPWNTEFSPSELNIQGMAVNPRNSKHIVVAWGDNAYDAQTAGYNSIWVSNNNGNTRSWTRGNVPSPGVRFIGNDDVNLHDLGGDCIIFAPDPNTGNQNEYDMYMGGAPVGSNYSKLFRSLDKGYNWTPVTNYPLNTQIITSIAMKSSSQHIWVGTSGGVYISENLGQTWSNLIPLTNVKRVLLWGSDANRVGFVTYGNTNTAGIGKIKKVGGNWQFTNLTGDVNSGFNRNISNAQNTSLFTNLMFPYKTNGTGIDENHLIAGRYGRPIRESYGNGTTEPGDNWGGNEIGGFIANDFQIFFRFENINNVAGHEIPGQPYVYTGLNNVTQNPHYPGTWYSSGGGGCFRSLNVSIDNTPPGGPNYQSASFNGAVWNYAVKNMALPVVNDISFSETTGKTYFPIFDWIMASRSNTSGFDAQMYYDRRSIYSLGGEGYMTNASRYLVNPLNPNIGYVLGGSQVGNQRLAIYKRTEGNPPTINQITSGGDLPLATNNRYVCDGVSFKTGTNAFRTVALVGGGDFKAIANTGYTGIYYRDNENTSWFLAAFDGQSDDPNVSTQEAYENSLLPAPGIIGNRSSSQFNLVYTGDNANITNELYLYLEGLGTSAGGVFRSINGGANWSYKGAPQFSGTFTYRDEGSIKYANVNSVGTLYLAIRGNIQGGRTGGLFKSINQGVNWTTLNGNGGVWEEARVIDVLKTTSEEKIAVFGRRKINGVADNYCTLYKSTNGGTDWQRIPENSTSAPLPLFPNVRTLKINPEVGKRNQLWIGTGGMGVNIYYLMGGNTDAPPMYITQNTTLSTGYIDQDIIVQNGATLTIEDQNGNTVFDMGPNRKIEVQAGSRIVANNVTFGCPLGTWQGIKLYNAYPCQFTGCTFNNAILPVEIWNSISGYSYYFKKFQGCNFNLPSSGTICIAGYEIANIIADGCNFNMTGSTNSYGLYIENQGSGSSGPAGPMGPAPKSIIQNNTFTEGNYQVYLNCQLAGFSSYHINGNNFNKNSGNATVGVFANTISGNFKNNRFNSSSFFKNVILYNSTLNIFGNRFNGNQNVNMEMNVNNTAQLAPVITENGYTIWYGGQNRLSMLNPVSTTAGNVTFTEGCTFSADRGRNCFVLQNAANNFHVSGSLPLPCGDSPYLIRQNNWNTGPNLNILCGGFPAWVDYSIPYTCPAEEEEFDGVVSGYQVTDLGNGYYDTVYISSSPGGSGNASGNEDKTLYSNSLTKKSQRNYSGAIADLKNLLAVHDSSVYLLPALDELFLCYKFSDTSGNQNLTNVLFSGLNVFLTERMQQYSSKPSFVDKAYRYYLMSLARMKQYSEAISGYENIIQNHTNPVTRLTATWDRAAAILLMNGSGGGESSESISELTAENLETLFDRNPAHKIAFDSYKSEKERSIKENNLSDGNVSENKIQNIDKRTGYEKSKLAVVESRISLFNPSNRPELSNRIQEDLKLLLGLNKSDNSNNNSIPLEFRLHQNYPNPFNPVTTIKYDLPMDANVKIKIYDLLGREVANLINNDFKKAGSYHIEWNAGNFASGVYFYRIEAGSFVQSKKMVLVK